MFSRLTGYNKIEFLSELKGTKRSLQKILRSDTNLEVQSETSSEKNLNKEINVQLTFWNRFLNNLTCQQSGNCNLF